jgi:sugar lactone lactonase YvrE
MYVDDDQTIYVADSENHRIMEWKCDRTRGQVVAGGNGEGNKTNQLNHPTDVIVDKLGDNLIICDRINRRVMRWPRRNGTSGQPVISNLACCRLTLDNNGYLYVSDYEKHEVRRWKINDTCGTLVAGGHGKGNGLNQLSCPTSLFVDEDHSVYVSDVDNHRVMKWMKGAKEGIVVAGDQGNGNGLTQLPYPQGLLIDHLGTVYVADSLNDRIMRWSKGAMQGNIVVGENGQGEKANQFHFPKSLSFDRQGNLYVLDSMNHRVQRFNIDQS